jgi:hypothetical protein
MIQTLPPPLKLEAVPTEDPSALTAMVPALHESEFQAAALACRGTLIRDPVITRHMGIWLREALRLEPRNQSDLPISIRIEGSWASAHSTACVHSTARRVSACFCLW